MTYVVVQFRVVGIVCVTALAPCQQRVDRDAHFTHTTSRVFLAAFRPMDEQGIDHTDPSDRCLGGRAFHSVVQGLG